MSKMMIYAPLSAIGGTIENVWGTEMRVKSIDSSDKEQVEQAKANGWQKDAQSVIDEIEGAKLIAENDDMKSKLAEKPKASRSKRTTKATKDSE